MPATRINGDKCLTCTRLDDCEIVNVMGDRLCLDCNIKWGCGFKDFLRSFSIDIFSETIQSTLLPQYEYGFENIKNAPIYKTNTTWNCPIVKSEYLYSSETDGTFASGISDNSIIQDKRKRPDWSNPVGAFLLCNI